MTREQILRAAELIQPLDEGAIVNFIEIGSEGCVLRTVVPGPMRGPGTYLISRDGVAVAHDGEVHRCTCYFKRRSFLDRVIIHAPDCPTRRSSYRLIWIKGTAVTEWLRFKAKWET